MENFSHETDLGHSHHQDAEGGVAMLGGRLPLSLVARCLYFLEPADLPAVARTCRALAECVRVVAPSLRLRAERELGLRHIERTFHTAGYRQGIEVMEDRLLQHGFNEGFILSSARNLQIGVHRGVATALVHFFNTRLKANTLPPAIANLLVQQGGDNTHDGLLSRLHLINCRLNALAKELDFPAAMCNLVDSATLDDCNHIRNSRVGIPIFDLFEPVSIAKPVLQTSEQCTQDANPQDTESEVVVQRQTPKTSSSSRTQPSSESSEQKGKPYWRLDVDPENYDGVVAAQTLLDTDLDTVASRLPMPKEWHDSLVECVQTVVREIQQLRNITAPLSPPNQLARKWLLNAARELKKLELKAKGIFMDAALYDIYPPPNPGMVRNKISLEEGLDLSDDDDDSTRRGLDNGLGNATTFGYDDFM